MGTAQKSPQKNIQMPAMMGVLGCSAQARTTAVIEGLAIFIAENEKAGVPKIVTTHTHTTAIISCAGYGVPELAKLVRRSCRVDTGLIGKCLKRNDRREILEVVVWKRWRVLL